MADYGGGTVYGGGTAYGGGFVEVDASVAALAHVSGASEFVVDASKASLNPTAAPGGVDVIYRMRARDLTLGEIVYWTSSVVDDAGAFYGGPGPLINVVATRVLCENL